MKIMTAWNKFVLLICLILNAYTVYAEKKRDLPFFYKDHRVDYTLGFRRISVSFPGSQNYHYGFKSNVGYRFTLPFELSSLNNRFYMGVDWIRTNYFRRGIDFNSMTLQMYGAAFKIGATSTLSQRSAVDFDFSYQVEEIFCNSIGVQLSYNFYFNKNVSIFSALGYRDFFTAASSISTSEVNLNFGLGISF